MPELTIRLKIFRINYKSFQRVTMSLVVILTEVISIVLTLLIHIDRCKILHNKQTIKTDRRTKNTPMQKLQFAN